MLHPQRVRSFANPRRGLAGNACNVHFGAWPEAPVPSDEYHCHVQPADADRYEVQCFFGRQPVQCCGHGLLAAAALLFARQSTASAQLSMNGSLVEAALDHHSHIIWLSFASLEPLQAQPQDQDLRSGLARMMGSGHACSDVKLAGPDDGYLVARLPDGFDLTSLSPPGAALEQITRRALIATTLLDAAGAIGLRYFAPQYGVAEDSATGSAMRVLARYWADRFQNLTATQFSPAGGELFSSICGATTRIGGRVVT